AARRDRRAPAAGALTRALDRRAWQALLRGVAQPLPCRQRLEQRNEAPGDLIDTGTGVDGAQQPLRAVVVRQRLGLLFVDLETAPHGGLLVIRALHQRGMAGTLVAARCRAGRRGVDIEYPAALRAAAAAGDAFDDLAVIHLEQHHRVERSAQRGQHVR